MIKTGIEKMDISFGGEIKPGSVVLFHAEPGVENMEFAYETLFTTLKSNTQAMYFVNNKKPEVVMECMQDYGWDISEFQDNFNFIDSYSCLLGMHPDSGVFVDNPTDIKKINEVLLDAIRKNKNSILIFDALSSFLDLDISPEILFRYLADWIKTAKKNKVTLLFLFTEWKYDDFIIDKIREFSDSVVDLKAIEKKIILRKYFCVSKVGWKDAHESEDVPFKIIIPGGIKIYIPKILVTGPFHAGKTSFVHSAAYKSVSVNRTGIDSKDETTVALDFGHVKLGSFVVELFGTPGQARFDPLLKRLGGEAFGVVLVVDATDPNNFVRAKEMLEKTKTTGLPTVLVANKSNLPNAITTEKIHNQMKLSKDIPVIGVTAEELDKVVAGKPCKLKKEDIEKVLNTLFKMVV